MQLPGRSGSLCCRGWTGSVGPGQRRECLDRAVSAGCCACFGAAWQISRAPSLKQCLLCLLLVLQQEKWRVPSLGERWLLMGGLFALVLGGEKPEARWAALDCRALTSGEAVRSGAQSSAQC